MPVWVGQGYRLLGRRLSEPLSRRANNCKFAGYGPTDPRSSPRMHPGSRRPAWGSRQSLLVLAYSRRYGRGLRLLIEHAAASKYCSPSSVTVDSVRTSMSVMGILQQLARWAIDRAL